VTIVMSHHSANSMFLSVHLLIVAFFFVILRLVLAIYMCVSCTFVCHFNKVWWWRCSLL